MKILCLNNKIKECSVYQYGYRIFNILTKSLNNLYVYIEIENEHEYKNVLNQDYDLVLYNYHGLTMSWLNKYNIQIKTVNLGITHCPEIKDCPDIFDNFISVSVMSHEVPRPLYENVDKLLENYSPSSENIKNFIEYKEDDTPIFGSFGFGETHKNFHEIVRLINEQYDKAIIKLNIGIGHDVSHIINDCKKNNVKSSIKLMITTEFFTNLDIVKFLSVNSMNILLYNDSYNNGLSSTIDYALSVKKPLGISKYVGFKHIYSDKICLYEVPIEQCMKVSVEHCDIYRDKFSNKNLIQYFDNFVSRDCSLKKLSKDVFVYNVLGNKTNGFYLDIGCGDCIDPKNNTLSLSKIGWEGIGIGTNDSFMWGWKHLRGHKFIFWKIDWDKFIEENDLVKKIVDYISFQKQDELTIFPWNKIRAKVIAITYENKKIQDTMRLILKSNGYKLLQIHFEYEDLWVDPKEVDMNVAETFNSIVDKLISKPLKYLAHGKFGDFIHTLSVICENFYKTGRKGILYLSNTFIDHIYTYNDTYDIIIKQKYIQDYKLHNDETYDIDLGKWRMNNLLFKSSWYYIYSTEYNIQWGKHKWIEVESDSSLEDTVVIALRNINERPVNIHFNMLRKKYDKLLLICDDIHIYNNFVERTKINIDYRIIKDFKEMTRVINSCKLFIGSPSAPLAIAMSMHKELIYMLLDILPLDNLALGLDNFFPNVKYFQTF